MSIGGDGYGERDRTGQDDPTYGRDSGRLTTRTRLPEGEGGTRPTPRPGRSLVTVVGVVVVLIAAIAFANQGGGGDTDEAGSAGDKGGDPAEAQPTAPSGEKPVKSPEGTVGTGFPQSKQGAESAAANYAAALGGDGMFDKESRHQIVKTVGDPSSIDKLQAGFDADYSPSLNKKIGIDKNGKAPEGSTFVNRTMPAGTSLKSFKEDSAQVSVWCAGLFGVAGQESTNPVKNSWFTVKINLKWADDGWKVASSVQKDGPTPVAGDSPISGAKEISKVLEEYGGFTYAR